MYTNIVDACRELITCGYLLRSRAEWSSQRAWKAVARPHPVCAPRARSGNLVCVLSSLSPVLSMTCRLRAVVAITFVKNRILSRSVTLTLMPCANRVVLWIVDPHLQKLELQRTAIDCLSTVISLAGPETTGMLLAHRVPATLCACIRRHSCPTPQLGAATPTRDGAVCSALYYRQRLFALVHPAVRVLARLVHPTGAQWAPICAMPFHEATARRRLGSTIPVAIASGHAVDAKAAAELGASVWQQTAKHLLEAGGCDGSGGSDEESAVPSPTARGAGSGRGRRGINEADNSAIGVLCRVLCDAEEFSCGSATSRGPEGGSTAQAIDRSAGSRDRSSGGQDVKIAALRVLLHGCRASFGVAHAVAAFDGGAIVQALLDRLCLPSTTEGAAANVSIKRPKLKLQ